MRKALAIGLLTACGSALLSFLVPDRKPERVHRWVVQPASSLTVAGKTNVNTFRCQIQSYCGRDTLILQDAGPRPPRFLKGNVALEANGFSCGNAIMTTDFHKTIQTGRYPQIGIAFLSLERFPAHTCRHEWMKANLVITLAGTSRQFEMDCSIESEADGMFHLSGSRCFEFSDFGLEAPSKMFGLIKVNETLDVSFHLVMRGS